jgi:hypothetical protein
VSPYGELRVFQTLGRGTVVETVETPVGVEEAGVLVLPGPTGVVAGAEPTCTVVTGGSYS